MASRKGAWTFFNQPLAVKQVYLHPSRNLNRGYTPFAEERNAASAGMGDAADLREGFIFGPLELPEGIEAGTVAAHAYQPNIWPEALPGVAEAFRKYYEGVATFNRVLLSIFETALDLPPGYFKESSGIIHRRSGFCIIQDRTLFRKKDNCGVAPTPISDRILFCWRMMRRGDYRC